MSKTIAKINVTSPEITYTAGGEARLTVTICPECRHIAQYIEKQQHEKYTLTLAEYRNDRSLAQNRLMWALLSIMAKEQGQDEWSCYIDILEKYGGKFEYIECLESAFPTLKQMFRAVKVVDERTKPNGAKTVMCKAFVGSSQYDTSEMNSLIEAIFNELAAMGVEDDKEVGYLWLEHQASCRDQKKATSAGKAGD